MAAQISCVNKQPRNDPHLRISHVGGVNDQGQRWKWTTDQAIAAIEARTHTFYVMAGGRRADVIVAVSVAGNKYLKTTADDTRVDNLLSLPEC